MRYLRILPEALWWRLFFHILYLPPVRILMMSTSMCTILVAAGWWSCTHCDGWTARITTAGAPLCLHRVGEETWYHIYLYTAAAHSCDAHLYVYLHKYIYIYKCIGYVWIATHFQQCISRWLCYILYSYFDSLGCFYMRRLQVVSLMTSRTLFHAHSLRQNAVGSS